MVNGKKLAEETAMPSVLEDDDAGAESEKLQLGEPRASWTEVGVRGPEDGPSSLDGNDQDRGEQEGEEEDEEDEELGGEESVISDEDYDTDLELGGKEAYDPSGQARYMEACEMLQVVPASYFLRHVKDSELNMMHRGLGAQGAKALAVPLVTNTSILRLNLRDNWMEGLGGAAIAEMLKENCYITGGFYWAMKHAHIISSLSPHRVSPFSKKKVLPALPLVRHSHLNYMPLHTVKHLGSLFLFAECQSCVQFRNLQVGSEDDSCDSRRLLYF